MEVYKFNKSLLDRLEESMIVLPWKEGIITASQVRENWISFLELQIEPTGWQAIWHVPRVICESLKMRFPTFLFGYVEQVLFKELRAVFVVEAVQEEGVNLKERHEVALEELWPTINQEHDSLNVERTADSLDRFRFFYTHVWMPWDKDNDDDLNWVEKHLESRIRFCYDLRKGCIKRKVAQHIRALLTEAKYIQQRREFLELDFSDDEDNDESTMESSQVTELMKLHLRLSMIRNEIEILENPEMRQIYEQFYMSDTEECEENEKAATSKDEIKRSKTDPKKYCFIITQTCNLSRQIELLRKVEALIDPNCQVELSPLLINALSKSKRHDMIFLAPGKHRLKFLEYLNEDGFMSGIIANNKLQSSSYKMSPEDDAILSSVDDDSMLLVINGDYTLENLVFDCHNVRTGILLKLCGNVTLRNCRLIGDGKSSTQQGIVCTGKSKLTLINCTVENFGNGIVMQNGTALFLKQSRIIDCTIGLEISGKSELTAKDTRIINTRKYGILVKNVCSENFKKKCIDLDTFKQLTEITTFTGGCDFEHCKNNIHVLNGNTAMISSSSLKSDESDSEEYED